MATSRPHPIYRCPRCLNWLHRNGDATPPRCKVCRTMNGKGHMNAATMYATVRVEPEPAPAWDTVFEDL